MVRGYSTQLNGKSLGISRDQGKRAMTRGSGKGKEGNVLFNDERQWERLMRVEIAVTTHGISRAAVCVVR